ncbi:MAG: TlpA family protein disulfide reductase [Helicobacter sp.]|nr:TlpA family protein disulfide reductase [Helicobacter sp.]
MKTSLQILIVLLALAGCNTQTSADIGQSAPKIAAKQLDGQALAPHTMQGKAVVLAFFKNGCASCLKDLPKLNTMAQEQRDKLVVLAINALDSPETIADMAQRFGWDSMILLKDELGITSKRYDVAVTPTLIILDKNGIIAARIVGERAWEGTEKILYEVL